MIIAQKIFKPVLCFVVLIAISISCLNETGKDKHPDIPLFPRTTNQKVTFKLLSDNYSEIFFNDQNIIIAKSDSILVTNLSDLAENQRVIPGYFQCYQNNSFIYWTENQYFALNDKDFTTMKVELIEENQKYDDIIDSIAKIQKPNTEANTKLADSIYVSYFFKKYEISPDVLPYIDYLGNNYYMHTVKKDFILKEPPQILKDLLYDQNKPVVKFEYKNIYKKFDYREAKSSTTFKNFDYAMMDKSWNSSRGGNHFIPAIPLFEETGYSYYRFLLGGAEGKFKISGSQSMKLYDIISGKNYVILVAGTGIYLAEY